MYVVYVCNVCSSAMVLCSGKITESSRFRRAREIPKRSLQPYTGRGRWRDSSHSSTSVTNALWWSWWWWWWWWYYDIMWTLLIFCWPNIGRRIIGWMAAGRCLLVMTALLLLLHMQCSVIFPLQLWDGGATASYKSWRIGTSAALYLVFWGPRSVLFM